MSKKLFSKIFVLLLVVGLLFAVAPTGQALAQTVPYTPDVSIQKAADEIVNSQMTEGGWGATGMVAPQTVGVIGSALIDAYARTEDAGHLASINAAAAYLMTKTNNFSPADGMFAAKLDALLGGTTYTTFVKKNFFDKLADGTYGATGDIDTAEYIHDLYSYYVDPGTGVETRVGDGYMNHEDPALGLISADLCGADVTLWVDAVKTDLNTVDMVWDFDPMMVASKGIYSLHFVGQTFDPTGGSFAAASDLAGMAAQLAGYQLTDGGFAVDDYSNISDVEATGYVIIALDISSPAAYQTAIQDAADWLLSVQNAAGYWEYWGTENYANTAAAVQAVNEAYPAVTVPPTKLNMSPAAPLATTGTCGATTVDVMVTDVTDLVGYHLEVLFDPNLVTIDSVTNGGFLDATDAFYEPTNTIDTTNGRIIWGMTQKGSAGNWNPKDGDGSLITITFTPKVAGAIEFAIDGAFALLPTDPDAFSAPFEVTGGATFTFGSVVTNTTKSPTVSYCDLATAVSAATSGDTLRADVDFETTASVNLNKTIIFNTNGHTITRKNAASDYDSIFYVNASGNLTVNGGGTLNSYSETATDLGAAIQLAGPLFKTASVILEAGTTLSGGYSSIYVYRGTFTMTGGTVTDGIAMMTGGTANISGGVVQGSGAAISGNSSQSDSNITISGTAEIDGGDGWAIYHPQRGNLNINGGTITGATGVEMRAGTLTISGSPTITATAGDAILINGDVSSAYLGLLSATISGGEFTSTGGYALHETAPATTRTSNIAVSGGKFTGSLGAVQFTTVDPFILKLTDGAYNTDPGATPDYVFEPLDTYQSTVDNYYYIDTIISGTIAVHEWLTGIATQVGDKVDFMGVIPWYPADVDLGRVQGNRVGVIITEPEGVDLTGATIEIVANGAVYHSDTWAASKDDLAHNYVPYWPLLDATFPDLFTITVQWNPVSTQIFTVNVSTGSTLALPPEPIITSTDIQGYYLTGEAREFNVNLVMPVDGANYALLIFDYKLAGVSTADITSFEYFAQDLNQWIVMGSRPQETYYDCDGGICGQFGWAPGGFGPIAAGFTNTSTFRINFKNAFTAPLTFTVDLSGKFLATDPVWTKLTTYTGSLNVYPKPVITSTELAGPFQQGQEETVTINVGNVGLMNDPNSFILHLDLPAGTEVFYDGVTYTCGDTGCDIPVTLVAGANAIDLDITFNAAYNGLVTVTLLDPALTPARELATFEQTVVVYGNVELVTGTVSMQGRLTTAGVPVTLEGTLGYAPVTVPSVEGVSGNLTFADLAVDTYTITTSQPRYLNITAAMAKTIDISADTVITALRLLGGNAIYTDNVIDEGDLGKVGLGYTAGITSHPDADVNFDNRINIQDLALVGGNFDLTSETAPTYLNWQP